MRADHFDIKMYYLESGRGRIRTTVGESRLIYSQIPLSTRAPARSYSTRINVLRLPSLRPKNPHVGQGLYA